MKHFWYKFISHLCITAHLFIRLITCDDLILSVYEIHAFLLVVEWGPLLVSSYFLWQLGDGQPLQVEFRIGGLVNVKNTTLVSFSPLYLSFGIKGKSCCVWTFTYDLESDLPYPGSENRSQFAACMCEFETLLPHLTRGTVEGKSMDKIYLHSQTNIFIWSVWNCACDPT